MNRRHFLTSIAAAIGGLVLDPERALFVPGKKLISIPSPAPVTLVTTVGWSGSSLVKGDVIQIPGRFAVHRDTGKSLPYHQLFVVLEDVGESGPMLFPYWPKNAGITPKDIMQIGAPNTFTVTAS